MSINAVKLMRLMSWLSPALPTGAYSYSHALEWAVEAGRVRDRASLIDWLEADLRHGSGRNDAILFVNAWTLFPCERGWREAEGPRPKGAEAPGEGGKNLSALIIGSPSPGSDLRSSPPSPARGEGESTFLALAELAAVMRGAAELALEAAAQGAAFLAIIRKAWPHPQLDHLADLLRQADIAPTLPIAVSAACRVHEIALEAALPLYLHSAIANFVNAGVRLIPLGQSDGQIAIAALEKAVCATASEAFTASLDDLGSAALMIDIASMHHETQYTRLFRS